ncbi:MAG TPA: hypothetical protein VF585_11875 [Chthoniobacterales bacterium]|jgi:hypothetical protein
MDFKISVGKDGLSIQINDTYYVVSNLRFEPSAASCITTLALAVAGYLLWKRLQRS